ncbi:MAG: winged helix-turn-helix transcriptional regulator [Chloroflexi bacterium]|nr:winged helix-turn-helix transcriptional regulator [Chloroflexota bacterium]
MTGSDAPVTVGRADAPDQRIDAPPEGPRVKPLEVPQARLAAKLYRGLADPARFGLLVALRDGPQAAGDLAKRTGLSPSRASNHLLCLLECGLVRVEPEGRRNVYRLADPAVECVLDSSRALLAQVGPRIEACLNYGTPARRNLRPLSGREAVVMRGGLIDP